MKTSQNNTFLENYISNSQKNPYAPKVRVDDCFFFSPEKYLEALKKTPNTPINNSLQDYVITHVDLQKAASRPNYMGLLILAMMAAGLALMILVHPLFFIMTAASMLAMLALNYSSSNTDKLSEDFKEKGDKLLAELSNKEPIAIKGSGLLDAPEEPFYPTLVYGIDPLKA